MIVRLPGFTHYIAKITLFCTQLFLLLPFYGLGQRIVTAESVNPALTFYIVPSGKPRLESADCTARWPTTWLFVKNASTGSIDTIPYMFDKNDELVIKADETQITILARGCYKVWIGLGSWKYDGREIRHGRVRELPGNQIPMGMIPPGYAYSGHSYELLDVRKIRFTTTSGIHGTQRKERKTESFTINIDKNESPVAMDEFQRQRHIADMLDPL